MTTLYRDHPHACGDKALSHNSPTALKGSSPRVWGQVSLARAIPAFFGIIPTRVGTRRVATLDVSLFGDHPHACGDKHQCLKSDCFYRGSSPRVWGQACQYFSFSSDTRIIPTRVGTSRRVQAFVIAVWDHPHACGDKFLSLFVRGQGAGSSPRVWGQASVGAFRFPIFRIIPMRVGTSL